MGDMSYHCMVLCDPPEDRIGKSKHCFQIIAASLIEAFEKLPHVRVTPFNIYQNPFRVPLDEIRRQDPQVFFKPLVEMVPEADLLVYVDWDRSDVFPLQDMKAKAGAKQIFSLLEAPINGVDCCFCFRDTGLDVEKQIIHAPCNKRLYSNRPKAKKIIVDHGWRSAEIEDQTEIISDWLAPLRDEFEIVRMTRFPYERETLKAHERELPHLDFSSFLEATDDAFAFIVTHRESYGFSVIDILARGIKVFTPPNMLAPELVDRFSLPTFSSQEDLLWLLRWPTTEDRWNHAIDKCTDYSEIAALMDERFRSCAEF